MPAFLLAYYALPRWYEFEERRWNDILTGKPKSSGKNLSQCHFVHHKSHMDWPGRVPGLCSERPGTNDLSHGTALLVQLAGKTQFSCSWEMLCSLSKLHTDQWKVRFCNVFTPSFSAHSCEVGAILWNHYAHMLTCTMQQKQVLVLWVVNISVISAAWRKVHTGHNVFQFLHKFSQ
jgi:hypothetical protein